MSTINDVQNAMVPVAELVLYPNTNTSPPILGNYISGISVSAGGSLYTNATVTITDVTGSGATAVATIVSGVITAITVLTPGINYSASPTVTITGDGSGATASAIVSAINVYVAAGDFLKQNVDAGLASRQAFVQIFAMNGMTRNTTRIRREYTDEYIPVATLTLTVSANTITVGGTITPGEAAMAIVAGTGYSYATLSGDTVDTVAASLGAKIPHATILGAVITVPNVYDIQARVSVQGTARRVLESQESILRVRIIAPDYPTRDQIGAAIQIGFASLSDSGLTGYQDYYMPMPDGVSASIRAKGIMEMNALEMANAFVRDYLYLVEYHTVQVSTFQQIQDAVPIITVGIPPLS